MDCHPANHSWRVRKAPVRRVICLPWGRFPPGPRRAGAALARAGPPLSESDRPTARLHVAVDRARPLPRRPRNPRFWWCIIPPQMFLSLKLQVRGGKMRAAWPACTRRTVRRGRDRPLRQVPSPRARAPPPPRARTWSARPPFSASPPPTLTAAPQPTLRPYKLSPCTRTPAA